MKIKEYSKLLEPYFLTEEDEFGETVIHRWDANSPVNSSGYLENTPRLSNWARFLRRYKEDFPETKFILLTHQGRKGNKENISTYSHANMLREDYKLNVKFCSEVPYGEEVKSKIDKLEPGEMLMLENTRFNGNWDWEKGTKNFQEQIDHPQTKKLSEIADTYINDAYPASHRGHSSLRAFYGTIPSFLGWHMQEEILKGEQLRKEMENAEKIICYIGGSKFKLKYYDPLMEEFPQMTLKTAGIPGIATAMAKGYELTKKDEKFIKNKKPENLKKAKELLEKYPDRIDHPIDWFVTDEDDKDDKDISPRDLKHIAKSKGMIVDIGIDTIRNYVDIYPSKEDHSCVSILAGPPGMGDKGWIYGTHGLLYLLSFRHTSLWVVGGHGASALPTGRELREMRKANVNYITAGGALLTHISGGELPALDSLLELEDTVNDIMN